MIRRLLPGVLLAVLAASGAHAARWPDWATVPSAAELQSRAGDAEAVVVLDRWELTVGRGERSGRRQQVVHVLEEDGRDFATFVFDRGPWSTFRHVKLWVRDPSGRVTAYEQDDGTLLARFEEKMLDDSVSLVVRPPSLVAGSTVAVQYDFTYSDDIPQDAFAVQRAIPVLAFSVHARVRHGWTVRARAAGGTLEGPPETADEATWSFDDVAAKPGLPGPFAPAPLRLMLVLDYVPPKGSDPFGSWGEVRRWAESLFDAVPRDDPGVDRLADDIAAAGGDPIAAAVRRVRALRYFAIEIGWGGLQPRPPGVTLRRGFGDCKDKSLLLVTLLRRLKIDAFPVLAISKFTRYVPDSIPGPLRFNHCIVGVRRGAGDGAPVRFIDPTLPEDAGVDTDADLADAFALPLTQGAGGLIRLPVAGDGRGTDTTRHAWSVDADGSVEDRLKRTYSGFLQDELLDDEGAPKPKSELRKEWIEELGPIGVDPASLEIEEAPQGESGRRTLVVRYRAADALRAFGTFRVMELGRLCDAGVVPIVKDKDTDALHAGFPRTVRDEHIFDAGAVDGDSLPEPFEVKNAIGTVACRVERLDGSVRVSRSVEIDATEFRREDRPLQEALQAAIRRLNAVKLVVRLP